MTTCFLSGHNMSRQDPDPTGSVVNLASQIRTLNSWLRIIRYGSSKKNYKSLTRYQKVKIQAFHSFPSLFYIISYLLISPQKVCSALGMFFFGNKGKCSSTFIYLYMAESRRGTGSSLLVIFYYQCLPDKATDSDPDTYLRIPHLYKKEVQNR